jgi:hypothetical protein
MSFRPQVSPAAAFAKIFQHRIGDGERSGWKYLNRTPAMSESVAQYYPRPLKVRRLLVCDGMVV